MWNREITRGENPTRNEVGPDMESPLTSAGPNRFQSPAVIEERTERVPSAPLSNLPP